MPHQAESRRLSKTCPRGAILSPVSGASTDHPAETAEPPARSIAHCRCSARYRCPILPPGGLKALCNSMACLHARHLFYRPRKTPPQRMHVTSKNTIQDNPALLSERDRLVPLSSGHSLIIEEQGGKICKRYVKFQPDEQGLSKKCIKHDEKSNLIRFATTFAGVTPPSLSLSEDRPAGRSYFWDSPCLKSFFHQGLCASSLSMAFSCSSSWSLIFMAARSSSCFLIRARSCRMTFLAFSRSVSL